MFQINRASYSSSNTVFFELNPKTTGTAIDFSTNSVFDNTYNLNIAPLRNPGSTNIVDNAW